MKATTMLALAGTAIAADMPSITMKGSKFFYPNGTQFFMKGVAYQREYTGGSHSTRATGSSKQYTDPLSDKKTCERDIPLLAELGTNTIRTYAIDPDANHDDCMKLLQQHNIYVVSDLSEPQTSINRDQPAWNLHLYERYTKVIDAMSKYPNVIGFFAGNEVSNNATNTPASAYVKAAVRDSKAYIKKNSKRWMGVGYAANDDKAIRAEMADYFNCGNSDESIDFWGYNIYSWCGTNTMKGSGYSDQVDFFKDYNVPVFFAEYGCNEPSGAEGRIFQETEALYSKEMTDVFSGGIVYMFHQEANDYGLVKIDGDKASKMKNFGALKKQVLKADPKGVSQNDYKPSGKARSCPAIGKAWKAASGLPPSPDKDLCDCMMKSLECTIDSDLDEKSYGELFGNICAHNNPACAGIAAKPELGNYGAYGMCKPDQQLAYVLDSYYKKNGKTAKACAWKGAKLQSASSVSGECQKRIDAAEKTNKDVASATSAISPSKTGSGDKDNAAIRGAPATGLAIGAAALAGAVFAL
ncbi:hypothetical protein VHEMI09947 [[Torrubiella] hemipterigena]|uniref:1,3-beta-glucanosyltransferase n=1 Tax=[Torrubiella] hemipterigena TaxID=1531966 RepID=A0A0A1TQY8_9HYPO|nr:hypothetical protein VHEMI09947 [[Torrubiella] hemipterigena]